MVPELDLVLRVGGGQRFHRLDLDACGQGNITYSPIALRLARRGRSVVKYDPPLRDKVGSQPLTGSAEPLVFNG